MSQDVAESIGYTLKRVQAGLRTAMDRRLQELGLGVSQYACLTLLSQRPGLSNAELARGVFVSRQATHQLLTGLREAGLIETAGIGRAQRLSLSRRGRAVLRTASAAVDTVEQQMLSSLSPADRRQLLRHLSACADALDAEDHRAP